MSFFFSFFPPLPFNVEKVKFFHFQDELRISIMSLILAISSATTGHHRLRSPSPPFRHWSGLWLVTFGKDAAEKRSNTTLSYKVSWPCWNLEGLRKIFMISSFSRGVGGWGSNPAQWLILKMVASRLSHKNTASSLLIMQHPGSPQSLTAMLLLPQTRYY